MYNLKGFFEYPALISNVPDKIAMFGEISDNSLTYAKDKTVHTDVSTPSVAFIAFHSVVDETPVEPAMTYVRPALQLGDYIYRQSIAGVINSNAATLRQLVLAEFTGVISTFSSGKMMYNGTLWMPEWVEFTVVNPNETNTVHIWLADESFAGQYDQYVIEVIQPLYPVDDFFKDPLVVKDLLAGYDVVAKLEEAQERRAQYPSTYLRAFEFNYVNPRDVNQKFPAKWIVLIYGVAGNNPDIIKEAIVKDILSQTTHNRAEWETILPDLFRTTEFIFTPFWNKYSVPNADFRAGIYSPVYDPNVQLKYILRTARGSGYTDTYVRANYQTSVNIYKSIAFGVVGNPNNRDGIKKFTQKFPQYVVTEVGDADANRIDPDTLEWMAIFDKLLVAAEAMTAYTSVPSGVSRMTRDGMIYASAYYKNINYMVASKGSIDSI